MRIETWSLLSAVLLFGGMVALGEAGRALALRRAAARGPEDDSRGVSVLDGAVFGLLGLIVAFSFGGAVSRFDAHRALVIEEANAIGSAYQFVDLVPAGSQPALRDGLRRYLDSRIALYDALPDVSTASAELARTQAIEAEIWTGAVAATAGDASATMLLLPAVDGMFDIAAKRTLGMLMHPPPVIFALMFALALASALLAGYGMARPGSRDWLRLTGFAAIASLAFYVILDIEFPRTGLIQIEGFDRALVELRSNMG